jgi:signal transduction histidine kinase
MLDHPVQILLIEDNTGDARLIREMLTTDSVIFHLQHVETLQEGVSAFTATHFDVALLDLSLPDSQGLDTLRHLRTKAPKLPIVVLTGFNDRRIGIQAVHSGAQDYLVKGEVSALLLQRALSYAIERQATHAQLLEFAAFEERQRLARELHDSVSQTLFSSSVVAETALRKFSRDPATAYQLLQELHTLTRSALAEMRLLLLELRPRAFEQVTLDVLLKHLGQSIEGKNGLTIEVNVQPAPMLDYEAKQAVYRIAQEALNNVIKHAQATYVSIRFALAGNRATLTVTDNGQGFDVNNAGRASLGLGIMHERALAIDAELQIDSAAGKGTIITVVWDRPVDPAY